MKCGGCHKAVRKTSLVWVKDGNGGVKQKRLGACCSKDAVLLLVGSISGTACKCGKPATTCVGCARDGEKKDAQKVLKAAVEKLRGILKAKRATRPADPSDGDFVEGTAAGLEQAIEFLEAGDFA